MKAQELRIGNWLQRLDGSEFQISHDDFAILRDLPGPIWPKPIPLSGERLLQFGFQEYNGMNAFFIKTIFGHLMIQFYGDRIYTYFTNVTADRRGMKMRGRHYVGNLDSTQNHIYVHQIQNLCFDLTGEELTKKP